MSFAYFPCLVFIITILVLPVSILLAKLSCQVTAVVHGNWAVSQARAKTPYDTVEVLSLRRRLGLAFVSLTDSQGKLLISEPRLIPEPILSGPPNQFVERFGWSMFRLRDEDAAGNSLTLATYGMSQFSLAPDTVLFGPSPQIGALELSYLLFYELALVSILVSRFYSSALDGLNRWLATLGENNGLALESNLAEPKAAPWYWSRELRELRGLMILRLTELRAHWLKERDRHSVNTNEQQKWRSTTLELERARAGDIPAPTRTTSVGVFAKLENLQDEFMLTLMQQLPCKPQAVFILLREQTGARANHWSLDRACSLDGRDCRVYERELERSNLNELCESLLGVQRTLSLGQMLLSQYRMDKVAADFQAQSVLCMLLGTPERVLGVLLILSLQSTAGSINSMERIWRVFEGEYARLHLARTSIYFTQIDKVTGLKNRKHVLEQLRDDSNCSLMPVVMGLSCPDANELERSQFLSLTVSLLNEFVRIWHQSESTSFETAVMEEGQFVLLCQGTARDVERILQALGPFLLRGLGGSDLSALAPNSLTTMTAATTTTTTTTTSSSSSSSSSSSLNGGPGVGVVFGVDFLGRQQSAPRSSLERLRRADRACEYGKRQSMSSGVIVVQADDVPSDFNDFSLGKSLSGKLGIFDAAEILQSLSAGRRSGRLTIEDRSGRMFQAWLEQGKLLSFTLEQGDVTFLGMDALLELVCTFHGGDFSFVELPTDAVQPQELPSLMNCLMEAALASDQLEVARQELSLEMVLRSTFDAEARARLLESEVLGQRELSLMKEAEALCREGLSLELLLEEFQGCPAARKWHCLCLMKRYGLLA